MKKNKTCNSVPTLFIVIFLLLLSAISLDVFGAEASDTNLFSMSLEQLMEVGVYAPASLTEKNPLKTPASVTTITSRDIELTPARNILDLIEIYVPGAFYMNHSTGQTLGMRGIITERPYKYLVILNGLNINVKDRWGAKLELMNWELSDIDRIEIVRGPGSVTYGPGAIGGVINIFTKKAKQNLGFQFGGSYWVKYDAVSNWVSYGRVKDDFQLYTFFSVTDVEGLSPHLYATDRTSSGGGTFRNGYLGDGGPYRPRPPITYMGNYYNEPEIKAHLDIQINENWRFWGRYATESPGIIQYNSTKWLINGEWRNLRQQRFRYFILALENQSTLNKDWSLKSTFSLSSVDVRDIQKQDTNITVNSKDNLQNYGRMFSEWKGYAQFMLNYKPQDSKIKGALGFEMSYDLTRPGWGKTKNNGLRLADAIMSGPDSDAYGPTSPSGQNRYNESSSLYYPVGNGWETFTHAFIGELNYELTPKTTMIISGRMDKHTYTDYAFSPRFALIQELRKDEYLKLILQQSVRLNTEEELYMNHKSKRPNAPERLDTVELIYSSKLTKDLSFQTSVFYNKNKAISWDADQRAATTVGTMRSYGLEAEMKYKKDNVELGISHSYVKQLSFKLSNHVYATGISYSDYFVAGVMGSHGNNINNWPDQATKIYTNIDLLDKKMTIHGDIRALWSFKGSEEGLNGLYDAIPPGGKSPRTQIEEMRKKGVFHTQVTGNVSLTYRINKTADLSVFLENIPVYGTNKRYQYNSGYDDADYRQPTKTSWVNEPMVLGFKYRLRF